jgi:galactonate dehydratase
MKITDIKAFPVWVGHRNQLVVKIETDEGLYGLGESGLSGRELAVAGAVKHFCNFLVGRDPMKRGALWQEMYRGQYFEGGRVLTAAISAIDMALYDIAGKALGVPVYQLLGGKHRDFIPTFATAQAPMGPEMIENVQALIERGWEAIRIGASMPKNDLHDSALFEPKKFGMLPRDESHDPSMYEPRETIGYTAHWMTKLREAVGMGPVLGVEYHHRLSVAETASFCQRMPPDTLDFLEEPIRDECPEAYEALRKMVDVPFAIGEEFASKWQFLPYIERGITNFARIDVCNIGGFTEAMKIAGWAEAHYIDMMPHNPLGPICTAASLHFAAAVPNFSWLEVWVNLKGDDRHNDDALFPIRPRIEGTRFPVPEAPGLGVEFNEELALKQPFKYWEAPHLHKRDGSYTNW